MMIPVLLSSICIAVGLVTPLLMPVEAPGLTGGPVARACDHCERTDAAWKNGTVTCAGSITIAHNFNGGQEGQCADAEGACDAQKCKWRGTVTVTNGTGSALPQVRIKYDGVIKKSCNNVPNGGQCQWNFTAGNPAAEIDCGDAANSKEIVVEVVLTGGATCSKSKKLTCGACPE